VSKGIADGSIRHPRSRCRKARGRRTAWKNWSGDLNGKVTKTGWHWVPKGLGGCHGAEYQDNGLSDPPPSLRVLMSQMRAKPAMRISP